MGSNPITRFALLSRHILPQVAERRDGREYDPQRRQQLARYGDEAIEDEEQEEQEVEG